jgi:LPS-assembly protein
MQIRRLSITVLLVLSGCFFAVNAGRAEEPAKKVPVTVKADKLDYDRANDVYVAEGHVRLDQDGMRLEADKVVLNNKTGEAVAEGKVYLQEKGDIIRADSVQININTKAGLIYNGDLFMSKDNLHLKGAEIDRKSETVYHIKDGIFTTCDAGEWYLKADEIDVDMERYATGTGVSFNMAGLPVFYTPYLLFPVRRQSGLLIPEIGYSSGEGFKMKNSVFWAMSDYQDMTFYSDYRARHGLGSAVEYRYNNSRDSSGTLFFNYFNTFDRYREVDKPDSRWLLQYRHHEEIAEDLSVRADLNMVSDFAYFQDLERRLEYRAEPYLDSNLFYVERWDTASLYLLGQYATDLTEKSNDNTIQKLPELRYNIFEEKVAGPFRMNFEGTATNFSRQTGDDVMRADFNPRLSAVFGTGGLTLTPRIGARGTYYDRSGVNAEFTEPAERKYYYAGADLNMRISRVYGSDQESGFGRIRHSIEPSLSYTYIPEIDQSRVPQLDVVDAVSARNTATLALTNRLTARYKDASGFRTYDFLLFRISQSYDVAKARTENSGGSERPYSDFHAELYLKTPKMLTISVAEDYDPYTRSFTSSSESATLTAGAYRFNFSHQYLLDPQTKYIIAGAGTTLGKWDVDVQIWHDILTKQTTQQEYKLHYGSQCWGLGLMYVEKPGERDYLLTLELKGLGALKF